MRRATFEVPSEIIGDFTEKLTEMDLDNTILGRTDNDEIEVQVSYEKEDSDKIDELESHLEELIANMDEEEEEDDK